MNKKGGGEVESAITLIFGVVIIFILLTSGFVSEVFSAFGGFGALGGLLAILFIFMIIAAIWEAVRRR